MNQLKSLSKHDLMDLRDLWLRKWHESNSFVQMTSVEQWVIVLIEFFETQEKKNAADKTNSRK